MELLRIGEVAKQAGVSTRTVDFYTSLGLITPAERTAGNFRLYDTAVIDRIAAIRQLEAHGVSLEQIATALRDGASSDMATQLNHLDRDLQTLRELADNTATDIYGLLTAIIARTHSLVTTAIEIANGATPG